MPSRKTTLLSLLGLATVAYADWCELTAGNTAYSTVNLGSTSATGNFNGFFLVINGGDQIDLTADTGNNFPPNYVCRSDDPDYAVAWFSDTPKGKIGMCIDNSDMIPGRQFDCEDLGGRFFEGTTDGNTYGLGTAVGSWCTISWEC